MGMRNDLEIWNKVHLCHQIFYLEILTVLMRNADGPQQARLRESARSLAVAAQGTGMAALLGSLSTFRSTTRPLTLCIIFTSHNILVPLCFFFA